MATQTVETIIANPARKRRTHMAKRMTLKQKLHFGSARVRAAAKQALRAARKRKARANTSRKRKSSRPRHRARSRKPNPGEIIAMTLGNPARRKKVAHTKRRRSTSRKSYAGHHRRPKKQKKHQHHNPARHRVYNRARRHHHRRMMNPAGHRWGDIFVLGGGALVGSTLSSAGTQLVLGSSNSGVMGYGANLVATFLLSWVGGMVVRNKSFQAGILAGGIGALMRRIIADYSLLGGYTSQLGMGDYLVSNWVTPQRLASDFRSLTDANVSQGQWGLQGSLPMSSSGISTRGLGLEGDPGTYGSVGY